MRFHQLFLHMRGSMRHYLVASAVTFIFGIYLGYADSNHFLFYLQDQIEHLKKITEGTDQSGIGGRFLIIFFNNAAVSLLMIFAGALFGVIPLFTLLTNGLLVGYLAVMETPKLGWFKFLLGVVPHGVVEIPALLLACAYGIKLGTLVAKALVFFPFASRRAVNNKAMMDYLKLSPTLIILLLALFLIAALIESTVTYSWVR
jgi:stage II sporulation protein M